VFHRALLRTRWPVAIAASTRRQTARCGGSSAISTAASRRLAARAAQRSWSTRGEGRRPDPPSAASAAPAAPSADDGDHEQRGPPGGSSAFDGSGRCAAETAKTDIARLRGHTSSRERCRRARCAVDGDAPARQKSATPSAWKPSTSGQRDDQRGDVARATSRASAAARSAAGSRSPGAMISDAMSPPSRRVLREIRPTRSASQAQTVAILAHLTCPQPSPWGISRQYHDDDSRLECGGRKSGQDRASGPLTLLLLRRALGGGPAPARLSSWRDGRRLPAPQRSPAPARSRRERAP
jgi:hypothetical protein